MVGVSLREKARRMIDRYGSKIVLTDEINDVTVKGKAIIEPLRYKNKLYLQGRFTEIGRNKEDYYLYIGSPDMDISAVDGVFVRLECGEKSYLVYRTEEHRIGDENIYNWAIIRPVTPDGEDET